jgi:hypothetical protein
VLISWETPSSNGAEVTSYEILIKGSDSNFHEDTTNCAGSTANTNCEIPMTVLAGSTWSLSLGNSIVARVRAVNSVGPGAYSSDSSTVATL